MQDGIISIGNDALERREEMDSLNREGPFFLVGDTELLLFVDDIPQKRIPTAQECLVLALGDCPSVSRLSSFVLPLHPKCDLGSGEGLNVSAKTGEGLEELKRAIVAKLEEKVRADDCGDVPEGDVAAYQETLALLGGGREEDLVLLANAVRGAAERLGAAVGATYSSDMLDNLFSRFCVGK